MSYTVKPTIHTTRSAMSSLADKYLVVDGNVYVVTSVYGPKMFCVPVDATDTAMPNLHIFEMKDGMVLYDDHPALIKTDDEPETAGPNAREFAHAVLKLREKGDLGPFTLQEIADFLEYDYNSVQKRAARLVRELGKLIHVQRIARQNYYMPADNNKLRDWLSGNAG